MIPTYNEKIKPAVDNYVDQKYSCKLFIKIRALLKQQLNSREYSHLGPKKFKLSEHLFALLFMQIAKLSFRRVSFILSELGFVVPTDRRAHV